MLSAIRFTTCDICHRLKSDISNKQLSLEGRLLALQQYRCHLSDQFNDRQTLWGLQHFSASGSGDVLTVLLDGMDQGKFSTPRDPALRSANSVCRSPCLESLLLKWS